MKLIQKDFSVEFKNLHEDDEEEGMFVFEGFASTFDNEDRDGDVIRFGAFNESLKAMTPALLWQHRMDKPVGTFIKVEERRDGLFVRGRMPLEDDLVRGRIVPQMKVGSVRTMSIGFSIQEAEDNRGVRVINKVKLWEISLVTIPANAEAVITGISKSVSGYKNLPIDFETKWDENGAQERLTKHTESTDEKISKTYRDAFLWADDNALDDLKSYKLPICDVVKGETIVIWKAVVGAAAAILKGIDIPEDDRDDIISILAKYYSKAEKAFPFTESKGMVDVEILGTLTQREVEKLLTGGIKFSGSAAKSVMSGWEGRNDRNSPRDVASGSVLNELKNITSMIKGGPNG